MFTSTYFALLAEFQTAQIPLEDMCEKYFNLSAPVARREAAKQTLPVPVFKLEEGQKNRYFVKAEALAKLIDARFEQAEKEWASVNK
jgi:hypothetical protein